MPREHVRRYLVAHPSAELYGSDRVMLESVAGMREAGADVTVVLPDDGPLTTELRAAGADVVIAPTLVLRKSLLKPAGWPRLLSGTIRGLRSSRKILKALQPDAVYVSTVTLPLWPVAARWSRIPAVVHLHEGEQGASALVKRGMYAPALLAQKVLVNSEFSRGVLREAFPRMAERAVVVYNGVAGPQRVAIPRERLEAPVRVVYVGRLSPRKGPDLLIEALALLDTDLPDMRLDLLGGVFPGYEWFEDALRQRITALGLEERVRLLGFRQDIWSVVEENDILVVPSRLDEPFGNTAVEGVIARRVVLASDTSGLREATAGVATAILFAPDDSSAIAEALRSAVAGWPNLAPQLEDEAAAASARYSPARYRKDIGTMMTAVSSLLRR
ncbi:Putative glycosyltransferase EpsD [Microbacterium lemovicicum]|uniref:Glycosyltransferase EpsD n=1 Tax=Microbacterium lemovicicum TaxID=1072463 RepID=A0A3Q9IVY6_9MICO|nr:glycosyltransferase [Microbacterium lemovicicum]AZS35602.1 Putative glycosyltransferase EpsD [Microbacterium lemovicicum]